MKTLYIITVVALCGGQNTMYFLDKSKANSTIAELRKDKEVVAFLEEDVITI